MSDGFPLLTLLLFLPLAGGLAVTCIPERLERLAAGAATAVSLAALGLGLAAAGRFDAASGIGPVERFDWIPRFGIAFHLGLDGLSLALVLLTLFLVPFALSGAAGGSAGGRNRFLGLMLALETGLLGVFMARDLVLFYLFWETMLIPAYFLLGVWGGRHRVRATTRFMIYTIAGSLLMLVGIMVLYVRQTAQGGWGTFDMEVLAESAAGAAAPWAFLLFAVAFAVKTPVFPFHSWLADAYVEAPTGLSMLMSGVMAKMGVYGFLRVCLPLFPGEARRYAAVAMALALAGALWGALMALAQRDLKRLIAWSSFSHMGFITLGVFSLTESGITGASFQMVSHGLTTGGLFLAASCLCRGGVGGGIESLSAGPAGGRRGGALLTFFALASLGMPGTASFIGEFLIVAGAFGAGAWTGLVACLAVAMGAWYMLRLLRRGVYQPPKLVVHGGVELTVRETALLIILGIALVILGIFPGVLTAILHAATAGILAAVGGA